MRAMTRGLRVSGLAALLLAGSILTAIAQDDDAPAAKKPEPAKKLEAKEAKKEEARSLKVFKLENVSAQDAFTALQLIVVGRANPGVSTTAVAATRSGSDLPPAIAMNERAKALFVRGTKNQIASVEKVLAAIDRESGAIEAAQFDSVHLIPVQHVPAQEVFAALSQLQIPAQVLSAGKGSLIVVVATDDQQDLISQAKEVVETLDVKEEKKEASKTEKSEDSAKPKPAATTASE